VSQARGKFLVIRGGAIGDFILTLPVFAALRRQFPQTHLEVLGYPHIAGLALAGRLVDAVCSIEARALAGFFAPRAPLDERLANYFAGFDVILSFLYDPDRIFQENVGRCARAQFIAGPHRPDEKIDLHATEVFLKPLERLAIFGADPTPRLELVDANGFTLPAGHWLALHPGSGSEKKNWPEANWRELIRRLLDLNDHRFLLVGGEAEGDRLGRLSSAIAAERLRVMRNSPLPELAGRLKQCVGFIGHDSGITHLAAALGLPGIVLWGDSNPTIWRPKNERMRLLRHPQGLARISVDDAIGRWLELFPRPA
jgi:ADP-heptose:LPS heptosyltransferase